MSYTQPFVVALDTSLENESEKVAKQLGLHFMGNLKKIQKQYKTNKVNLNNCYFFVVEKDKFYLKLGLRKVNKPIYCNFLKWSKDTKKNSTLPVVSLKENIIIQNIVCLIIDLCQENNTL